MATATRSHQGRYARAAAHRGQGLRRRKPPEPTGIKKVLSAVRPGAAAKQAAPRSKKGAAGGVALAAAAAAGVAVKLRSSRQKHGAAPPGSPVP
jgi:hypothetical protein